VVRKEQIEKIRSAIDQIDQEILMLIKKRLSFTEKIGQIKKTEKLDIVDSSREKKLFRLLADRCEEMNLDKVFIKNLWRLILNASYLSQENTHDKKTKR
jgi:chorismate mutase